MSRNEKPRSGRSPLRVAASCIAAAAGLVLPQFGATAARAVVPAPGTPACSVRAVPGVPLAPTILPKYGHYAALTATDNHGFWAGVRFDGNGVFRVIDWRNGVTSILDTYTFGNSYSLGAVSVVGMTSARTIIVDGETPGASTWGHQFVYRYTGGKHYPLAHNGSWTYWTATSVSPDGHVAGYALTPKGRLIVEWDQKGAVRTIVGGQVSQPLIDQYDDMIWLEVPPFNPRDPAPNRIRFRTPSGRLGQLVDGNLGVTVWLAAGRWVWGTDVGAGNAQSVVTWDMAGAAHSTALPMATRRPQPYFAVTGAASRAYVATLDNPPHNGAALYDAYGDGHVIPPAFEATSTGVPFFGVANDGTVATSGPSGKVYFMHCPLNYAKHNPRGLIYHGAVSAGQTVITGGAFDSDAVASHVSVDIYDETTSVRKRLTRIVADQYDPSFSSAYGISGNHRYRYVFPSVPGKQVYCAYGMNIGYGNTNTKLGCTTITT